MPEAFHRMLSATERGIRGPRGALTPAPYSMPVLLRSAFDGKLLAFTAGSDLFQSTAQHTVPLLLFQNRGGAPIGGGAPPGGGARPIGGGTTPGGGTVSPGTPGGRGGVPSNPSPSAPNRPGT